MNILLIKPDGIGDYLLFRNFLPLVKSHFGTFCFIDALFSPSIRGLADTIDAHVFRNIHWLRGDLIASTRWYQWIWKLRARLMTYDLLIYPNLSRVSAIDWLASQINAREKIASETDLSCISEKRARETDLFYTRLMPIDPQIPKFEFFRYQDFFSNWLGVKNVSRPTINRGHLPPVEARNSPYAMIFPGAGRQFRRYPADRLGSVANHIISTSDLDVIVAGSEEDAPLARMILSLVENKKRLHSICGKCNLAQTMAYASRSSMIVCHDSFSLHLAASLNIPFVCISDASDFGRYHPYPAEYGLTARFLYPPSAARMIGSEPDYARKICNQARQHKIVDIDVRDVLAAVDEVMAGVHRNGRSQSS